MANPRAIHKRLKAVKNIRKITRTMELIATARFKKAMDRATAAAAYTRKIAEIAADLSQAASGFTHPLLQAHESQKNGILLVLTSNRGLCGGYNSGVLRHLLTRLRQTKAEGDRLDLEVSGKRGLNFLRFQKVPVSQSYTQFEEKPSFEQVDVIASRFIDLYVTGKIDFVDVAYVRFESIAKQTAVLERILPFASATQAKTTEAAGNIEYEFLPSPRDILDEIVPAAFRARLFKCFLDAAVSEQIARMVAMKGATENAADMISTLTRTYNRARQGQITSELSEIIGGAEALNK